MKVLNKKSDYAVRALLALGAAGDGFLSARVIAEGQQMPYQFLRGLLQDLIRHGMVESREGARGGFRLVKDADEIALLDIIEIFQGPVQVSECMFRKQMCANRSNCVLRHEILRIEHVVQRELEHITIGKLMRDLEDAHRPQAKGNTETNIVKGVF